MRRLPRHVSASTPHPSGAPLSLSGVAIRRRSRSSGFTVIEMLVVMAIVAMLTSVLMPVAISWVEHARARDTERRLKSAYYGIYGRSALRDHGFLGDSGGMPAAGTAFKYNLTRPTGFKAGNIEGVRFGWHGTYAAPEFVEVDGWGNAISFDPRSGRIYSPGSDRVPAPCWPLGTCTAQKAGDDIAFPSLQDAPSPLPANADLAQPAVTTGNLIVQVLGPARTHPSSFVPVGRGLFGDEATVRASRPDSSLPSGGGAGWVNATISANGSYFIFTGATALSQGYHLIIAEGVSATGDQRALPFQELRGTATAYVQAGRTRYVRVYLREARPDMTP